MGTYNTGKGHRKSLYTLKKHCTALKIITIFIIWLNCLLPSFIISQQAFCLISMLEKCENCWMWNKPRSVSAAPFWMLVLMYHKSCFHQLLLIFLFYRQSLYRIIDISHHALTSWFKNNMLLLNTHNQERASVHVSCICQGAWLASMDKGYWIASETKVAFL